MFGNSKHYSVQPLQPYKPAEMTNKPLTAKYFIYDVVVWPLFYSFPRFLYVSGSNILRIYCKNCNPVCPIPFPYGSCNPYANICLGEILALRFCQSIFYPCREAIIAQPLVWCRSLFALNLKTESGCPYAPFTVANSTFRMLYHANHGNPVGSIKSGSFYRSPTTGCQTSLSYDNSRILVYYSAGTFKRPTHCLTTTFISRNYSQRRLYSYFLSREILPAGNQEKHVLRISYTCWESKG